MDRMILKDVSQVVDNDTGQVNSDCLSVPLILRQIFQYFSTKELIQLSLVNKFWNSEARSMMWNRGNLSASINKNHTCQDLRAFASDLRRMKQMKRVVPFSGMTIWVGGRNCANKDYCQQSPNRELEPVYDEIIDGLTWKHLSIRHLFSWDQHKSCPGFILPKKILKKLDSFLVELSIQLEWNEANYFKEEFLQDCYFSRLKTFEFLNEKVSYESEWTDLIKTVVSTAPNLQLLYTEECVNLKANLLEGSSAVHVAGSSYSPSWDRIPEAVASEIRMQGMHLVAFSRDFSLERFNRITSKILQSSRAVMRSMDIDVIFLAPLINYGVCIQNVKEFQLRLVRRDLEEIRPHIWKIAESFDYTRMFPNLKTITIRSRQHRSPPDEFYEMTNQVSAALGTPEPDRVANITNLKLVCLPRRVLQQRSSFYLLAQMFPHVQTLSITTSKLPFADIRYIWVDLKEVNLTFNCSVRTLTNLDSVFCGIFPEEVAHLREQDEEYLRRVNIVPVMPSIAYLRELRSIEVYCDNRGADIHAYTGPLDDPTCIFSKVTALVVFQRRSDLTLTLTSEDERLAEALGHLKPYASVVYQKMITFNEHRS